MQYTDKALKQLFVFQLFLLITGTSLLPPQSIDGGIGEPTY